MNSQERGEGEVESDDDDMLDGLAELLARNADGRLHRPVRPHGELGADSEPQRVSPSASTLNEASPEGVSHESAAGRDAITLPRPGLVIDGKRELLRRIGAGSFGSVYEARQRDLDRLEAVKFLHEHWLAAEFGEVRERFLAEARVMARMKGAHLVAVHDWGTLPGGLPYFVMERLEGKSLRARLQDDAQLSVAEIFDVAEGLLRGLCEVHDHDVVHRDVKPENTFLVDGGVKLLDFGLAKTSVAMTSNDVVMGTPLYMAPELITREGQPDARSDIYAVAVIVYEMIAGEPPFREPTYRQLADAIVHQAPRPLAEHEHRGELPRGLVSWVHRGLAKRRKGRHASARVMLDRLLVVRRAWEVEHRAEAGGGVGPKSGNPGLVTPAEKPTPTWSLVLKLDDIADDRLYEVLDALRRVTGDPSITLVRVDSGSIVLVLQMSDATAARVAQLVEASELAGVLGISVGGFGRTEVEGSRSLAARAGREVRAEAVQPSRGVGTVADAAGGRPNDAASSDEILLQGWRAGDKRAGEQLFERYAAMLARFFMNKVAEPDDLIQETFLFLVRGRERNSSVRSYVLGAAYTVLRRHYRRARRAREYVLAMSPSLQWMGPPPSPEDQVGQDEVKRLLLAALQRLSLVDRLVLELTYWEGMSASEVAEVLEWSTSSVLKRLHRARHRLKAAFDESPESEPTIWSGSLFGSPSGRGHSETTETTMRWFDDELKKLDD